MNIELSWYLWKNIFNHHVQHEILTYLGTETLNQKENKKNIWAFY